MKPQHLPTDREIGESLLALIPDRPNLTELTVTNPTPATTPECPHEHCHAEWQCDDCGSFFDHDLRPIPAKAAALPVPPVARSGAVGAWTLENARRDCEFAYRDANGDKSDPRVTAARTRFSALLALYRPAGEVEELRKARTYLLGRDGVQPCYSDGTPRNLTALIVALEEVVRREDPAAPAGETRAGGTTRHLHITCCFQDVDVVKYYHEKHGIAELPPTLTMTGAELKAEVPGLDPTYALYLERREPQSDEPICDNTSVALVDGMRFYSVPPATY